MRYPLILALTACGGPARDLGVFGGVLIVLDPADEAVEGPSDGEYTWECHMGAEPAAPTFTASGGEGTIEVVHTGVWSPCDTEWLVTGTMDDGEVHMRYEQFGYGTSCTCQNTLTYAIEGVPQGSWTVFAEVDGSSASVDVR